MKKTTFIFALYWGLIISLHTVAQVKFDKTNWQETLTKAKQQNKPIFLDIYASWCGPCKELDQKVYPDDKVAALMNEKFINFKADGEEGEGIELQKQFNISSYPTLIFIKPNGDKFYSYEGYRSPEEFIQEAEYALSIIAQPTVSDYVKLFEKGDRSKAFLQDYLNALYRDDYEHLFNETVLDAYIKTLSITDVGKKEVAETIWQQLPSVRLGSSASQFIQKNIAALYANGVEMEEEERLTTTQISQAVDSYFAYYDVKRAIHKNDEASVLQAIKTFERVTKEGTAWFSEPQSTVVTLKKEFYEHNGNTEKVMAVLEEEVAYIYVQLKNEANEKFVDSTAAATTNWAEPLNNAAWYFYENTDDLEELFKALEWSKKSIEIEEYAAYYDTYAHLLFKLDKVEEAIEAQRKAIALAYEYEEDATSYWRSLIEMKTEFKQSLDKVPMQPNEATLKKDIETYGRLTKQKRVDELLEYIPEKFFDFVPQENLCDLFYKLYHNNEIPITIEDVKLEKLYKIVSFEGTHYTVVKYNSTVVMDVSLLFADASEEDKNEQLNAYNIKFGKENVKYDKTTNTVRIMQQNKMYAIATEGTDSWKFINNEASMKGIIDEIIPKDVQKEFD